MTGRMEWDYPPTMRPRRRPRVEVLEPEESTRARFDIMVTRQRRPSPWIIAAIAVALLLLWRHGVAIAVAGLMLAALVGGEAVEASFSPPLFSALEVFAKHQDEEESNLSDAVSAGQTPPGVERHVVENERGRVETTILEVRPCGAPDPGKPHDSVQANLISRICAAKGKERQFPSDRPSLLWIDLRSFGAWPEVLKLEQCAPLISGHHGLTSGALWYAFYGWQGAPIFEEDFHLHERIVPMGHDGRFRLQGTKKSKLSGSIIALSETLVLFENPWPNYPLPDRARRFAERLPWFDLSHSICNWSSGDADILAGLGRRQIEAMQHWRDVFDPD
jgi:hypothetical protein